MSDKGATVLELLRQQRDEAHRHLEEVKDRDPHQWPKEKFEHYRKRLQRVRAHRANARKILEGLERRVEKAAERKQARRKKTRAEESSLKVGSGDIVTFDGVPCVEWIAHDLLQARKCGVWNGQLVSGYRTPEHSVEICMDMCGAPTCPGRCAGTSSNHTMKGQGQGAADVTDFVNCERALMEVGSSLHNDLPADLVHMSATGH